MRVADWNGCNDLNPGGGRNTAARIAADCGSSSVRVRNPVRRDEDMRGTSPAYRKRVGWWCSHSGVLKLPVNPSYRKMMWLEAGMGTPPPNSLPDGEICYMRVSTPAGGYTRQPVCGAGASIERRGPTRRWVVKFVPWKPPVPSATAAIAELANEPQTELVSSTSGLV